MVPSYVKGQGWPLQVYQRRARTTNTSNAPPKALLLENHHQDNIDLPIAFYKECQSIAKYPISQFILDAHLTTFHQAFTTNISSSLVPKNFSKVISQPTWKVSMDEMEALTSRPTWTLVRSSLGAHPVAYR